MLQVIVVPALTTLPSLARSTPTLRRERCAYVCKWLSHAFNAHIFAQPVDWQSLGLDDYSIIVKEPMDLATLARYVETDPEFTFAAFCDKARLIWTNACTYNPAPNPVHAIAQRIGNAFEKKVKAMQQSIDTHDDPRRLEHHLVPLVHVFYGEEDAQSWVNSVLDTCDPEWVAEYAVDVDVPLCFEDVIQMLQSHVYCNRHDVKTDVDAILTDMDNCRIQALSDSLFAARLPDVDASSFVTAEIRTQCADRIAMLSIAKRILLVDWIRTHAPNAVVDGDDGVSTVCIEMLNRAQFVYVHRKTLVP